MRWNKDRDESKERDTLIEETIMGLTRNLTLEKFPGFHKDDPLRLSIVERVPEMALVTLITVLNGTIEPSSSN